MEEDDCEEEVFIDDDPWIDGYVSALEDEQDEDDDFDEYDD